MKLGGMARARVALARPLARRIFDSPRILSQLAKGRPAELDLETAAILSLVDLLGMPETWELTPARARAQMLESIALADFRETSPIRVEERTLPGPAGDLHARLYVPKPPSSSTDSPSPGIVFFHGGGWVTGDLDSHDGLCRTLAAGAEARVIAIDYRLAPEHPFPAAVDDALTAFRWVVANAEALGMEAARIAVAGDSAGGNLSAIVARHTRDDARRPALAVLLYPALDATLASPSHAERGHGFYLTRKSIDWYLRHYLGADPSAYRNPDVSPLLARSLAGSPPTLVVAAGFDPLRDEAMAYAERLREAGVPTVSRCETGLIHGFAMMGGLSPASRDATERIVRETGRALREGLTSRAIA
jgi:acetyl esterase